MKAVVYKSTGSWYSVKTEDGTPYNARIKGAFKIEGLKSTNPVAVGDLVDIEDGDLENNVMITNIYDRHNYITRTSPHNKNQHHIIASNLDQCVLVATLREPKTSMGFVDRFLITAEAYHIPAIIVFNKADVYRKKEIEHFEHFKSMYESVGYKVILTSTVNGQGVDEVKDLLKEKITLISGHSGVGKSSFINIIFPEKNLKTKEVSGWSGKGMHTTTFAEMFDLPFGGKIIDTPGIRELGLVDISKQELSHYYPEMRDTLQDCQFNNCLHVEEPGCAIKAAVESGKIYADRYVSYLNILGTIEESYK
ncbi:ribosome small subunit-dependent GTPase A [Pinibacter aurantiacus]|uniref:Small ribosomal subunit biogenesis GTPase RsgA n=1 Tax=Pinibacter aurantiacus TaxID=2851599 RepID=A0A9E2S8E0_9BACT|nr:ribosome small subunit-dependent GTPase A [Pinibacter aurantiacus]MBV4356594.1 ribosome small subunit-dependent GTPase A [Pinibacter aurantiacus]